MMQEPSLIFNPARNQARKMINHAPRRDPPAGGKTLTIVRPREHPLSNYGTLVEFLSDRTCRNGRGAINSTTIWQFRSIIRKAAQFILSVQR